MITTLDQNTALVLIDLQKYIVQLTGAHPMADILEKSAQLVEAFRKAGKPIVVVHVEPTGAAFKTRRDNKANSMTELPADWSEIAPEIKTEPTDIFITKKTWGAFYNTGLHEELQKRGITQIVLAGVATSIGVEATARSANEFAYNIAFASDAMTDMFAEAHAHSFKYIFPRIGEVGTAAEIIEKLG